MWRLFFLYCCCCCLMTAVNAFVISPSRYVPPTPVCGLADELEEMWSVDPHDAMKVTTDLVRDKAFDYRKQVMMRITNNTDNNANTNNKAITEESVHEAEAEFQGAATTTTTTTTTASSIELKFVTDYKRDVNRAQERFIQAVERAETSFTKRISRIEASYEAALSRSSSNESAKQQYILQLSANHELFQIALEKAELDFEERKIKALQTKAKEEAFFQEFGQYMRSDPTPYLTPNFANLIAF